MNDGTVVVLDLIVAALRVALSITALLKQD